MLHNFNIKLLDCCKLSVLLVTFALRNTSPKSLF